MKITVIGGGGVRTVIFINGLLKRYKKLDIQTVVLYDTDREKLEIIGRLCRYLIAREGESLNLELAKDPVTAVKGGDYIVTTLRVGGDHSRVVDEEIALRMGVIGQETTGVGGFSMAVRTIPVLEEYCRLIKNHAPDAWIFNFTNPSGLVTQALRSGGNKRVIGICDAPSSTVYRMEQYLGTGEGELSVQFYGLNHLSWIRSVSLKGRELLPELLGDDAFLKGVQEFSMFDPQLLRAMGLLPNEYLYYYYHREKALANILHAREARGKAIETVNLQMMKELREMNMEEEPEEALQTFLYYMELRENSYMSVETGNRGKAVTPRGRLTVPDGMGYAGVMLDCIEGLQSQEGKALVLSVENKGCIPGLAEDDVVEATCHVSNKGIVPVPVKDVPEDCDLLMRLIKRYERLTAQAVKTRSKETAARALMLHPLVNSWSLAKDLTEAYDIAYGGLFSGKEA